MDHDFIGEIMFWLFEYKEPIATLLAATVAAIIAPLVGLAVYHRQKEAELVRDRYLDGGLDVIANNAEYALGIFRHNWARGLTTLKHFRDTGKDMPRDLYKSGYVDLQPTTYNTSHSFLLKELLGDSIFHEAQQLLYSFVMNSSSLIIHDLGSTIRISIEGSKEIYLNASKEEIVERYFEKMEELDKESNKFYLLLGALHDIASEFSRQKFQFETVDKFKAQAVVREKIEFLKGIFAEHLAEYRGESPNNATQPK